MELKHSYIFAYIFDSEKNKNDTVEIFIGANNPGTFEENLNYKLYFDQRDVQAADYSVTALDDGYIVEAAVTMHKNAVPGDIINFDIRITDADSGAVVSWNDPYNMQVHNPDRLGLATLQKRLNASCALYGTPIIDGEKTMFGTSRWNL